MDGTAFADTAFGGGGGGSSNSYSDNISATQYPKKNMKKKLYDSQGATFNRPWNHSKVSSARRHSCAMSVLSRHKSSVPFFKKCCGSLGFTIQSASCKMQGHGLSFHPSNDFLNHGRIRAFLALLQPGSTTCASVKSWLRYWQRYSMSRCHERPPQFLFVMQRTGVVSQWAWQV